MARKKKRNTYIYHGSPKKGLKLLNPRKGKRVSPQEKYKGRSVHATTFRKSAALYLANLDSNDLASNRAGYWLTDKQNIYVIRDKKKWGRMDNGGSIYRIKKTPSWKKSKGPVKDRNEWITKRKIKPVDEFQYDSAVDAMIDGGVTVYIPPQHIMKKIKKTNTLKDELRLLKQIKSENEKRENIKKKRRK
jgi:hypothetical protein